MRERESKCVGLGEMERESYKCVHTSSILVCARPEWNGFSIFNELCFESVWCVAAWPQFTAQTSFVGK